MDHAERIAAVFDRELAQADYDIEPDAHIAWLERLRVEVLTILGRDK